MIITIDGPSGSGKSTMAKMLAKELGFTFFDTGAMYRSVCWYLLHLNISIENESKIKEALENFHYRVVQTQRGPQFFVNDHEVTKEIRDNAISKQVSVVAAYPFVREKLVHLQKAFAADQNAVFEGRDMGTVVFPHADLKFFLVADPKVRAQRRYKELLTLYPNAILDVQEIEDEIIARDHYDSHRKHSPLKRAHDAIVVDSSSQSTEEILVLMKHQVEGLKA